MLVNILQKRIDEEKLIKEIQSFEIVHNETAYLFMNKETLGDLASHYGELPRFHSSENLSGMVGYYTGRRIYENERLKFGEVEIR